MKFISESNLVYLSLLFKLHPWLDTKDKFKNSYKNIYAREGKELSIKKVRGKWKVRLEFKIKRKGRQTFKEKRNNYEQNVENLQRKRSIRKENKCEIKRKKKEN